MKDSGSGNVGWLAFVPMRKAAAAANSAADPSAQTACGLSTVIEYPTVQE
ncbi:hypothetical protein I6I98_13255 [Sphingobacterium multivorum]|uniref:Uncharacterized protein n=1 Tax=Sphingobacterium multivorum TaxID=28454 RepID=A0ABX7CXG6_SPHMU|nr:hypothetical protein [Sphingobacterium multivorum]QQT56168.1 hypothetical protein I6I98_13255 [Sphingobacterium multivorum]